MATTTTKAGWLFKESHDIFRSWEQRWFVLEMQQLSYYRVDDVGNRELRGTIQLHACVVAAMPPDAVDGRACVFRLVPSMGKKTFLIAAASDVERDEWLEAICCNVSARISARTDSGFAAPPANRKHSSSVDMEVEEGGDIVRGSISLLPNETGAKLEDFELLKVIGRGSYGKVVQARRAGHPDLFAMKICKKAAVFARNDPKDLEHTVAERNVLAMVSQRDHPFLLGLRFAFHTPTKLYYLMDFCNGGDLAYLLWRCKRLQEAQARFYIGEIFLALQHLHGLTVIYRDLKPDNVLLDAGGHIKLTDFGLSKLSSEGTAETFCGTPVYLAPEVWLRQPYGFQVDWWSLGCLLYELVCGAPPFWGDSIKDVYKKVMAYDPRVSVVGSHTDLTAEVRALIDGLLQREPRLRLGAAVEANDIMHHAFFASLAWEHLAAKRLNPPYKSRADRQNFHKAYNNQLVESDSGLGDKFLSEEQQAQFAGFTYVPRNDAALQEVLGETAEEQATDQVWEALAQTHIAPAEDARTSNFTQAS